MLFRSFCVQQHRVLLPVYPRPSHAKSLTLAQAKPSRQQDCRINRVGSGQLQQRFQLVLGVILAVELILLGPVHSIKGIGVNQTIFERLTERSPHDGMVMDNRVGSHAVSEEGVVKVLDIFWL